MNQFDEVQLARRRNQTPDSKALAKMIVESAERDPRMAYDFLDMLNKHVSDLLRSQHHNA